MQKRCTSSLFAELHCLFHPFPVSEVEHRVYVLQECYRCLPEKTLSFFLAVHQQYNAEWIFKVDDDVYLSPDRIPLAVEQWDVMQVDYVGCMFHGEVNQEPQHRYPDLNTMLYEVCSDECLRFHRPSYVTAESCTPRSLVTVPRQALYTYPVGCCTIVYRKQVLEHSVPCFTAQFALQVKSIPHNVRFEAEL